MKSILSIAVLLVGALFVSAANQDMLADQVVGQDMLASYVAPHHPDYAAGCKRALEQNRPLVVFVGTGCKEIAGAVTCQALTLDGYSPGDVVVCAPDGQGWLAYVSTVDSAEKVVVPKLQMADCETGKCRPSFFPTGTVFSASFSTVKCEGPNCGGKNVCAADGGCRACMACQQANRVTSSYSTTTTTTTCSSIFSQGQRWTPIRNFFQRVGARSSGCSGGGGSQTSSCGQATGSQGSFRFSGSFSSSGCASCGK